MPKISALPTGSALTGAEIIPLVQGGTTKSVTPDDIATFIGATPGGTGNLEGMLSVKDFGAIGDGGSHPLSAFYATLADAQVDYFFATSLGQQIDYCACKACSNAAFGGDLELITAYLDLPNITWAPDQHTVIVSETYAVDELVGKAFFLQYASAPSFVSSQNILSNTANVITLVADYPFSLDNATDSKYAIGYGEHGNLSTLNKRIYIPPGRYVFGDDTWTIRNLNGTIIEGAGKTTSILTSNSVVMAFDGVWYVELANFAVQALTSGAVAALEIDGNVPGHDYPTRGVQSVTLRNMLFTTTGGNSCVWLNRQGGSAAQGDNILILNCHFSGAAYACWRQDGFNVLATTFIGGDMQNYAANGLYSLGGTVSLFNTSFECAQGYNQIANNGYDINVGDTGALEGCSIYACRTESLRFLRNAGGVRTDVRACVQRVALSGWFANSDYGVAASLGPAIAVPMTDKYRLFLATTEGHSGAVEPTWPTNGSPVSDNTVVWTEQEWRAVNGGGPIEFFASDFVGDVVCSDKNWTVPLTSSSSPYTIPAYVDAVVVDATAGPVTIVAPTIFSRGRTFAVYKCDVSSNAVTVSLPGQIESDLDDFGGLQATVVLDGGVRSSRTFIYAQVEAGVGRWLLASATWQSSNDTITQGTNKTTAVTLNTKQGQITTVNTNMNTATVTGFTLNNTVIKATDIIATSIKSGATANSYHVYVDAIADGSCHISLQNYSASNLAEAVVIGFAIMRATT